LCKNALVAASGSEAAKGRAHGAILVGLAAFFGRNRS
jgi:hypothetical protein